MPWHSRLPALGCVRRPLIKHHYFRNECVHVPNMNQGMRGGKCCKVLIEIAAIIRLVVALRKELQKPIIVWSVPTLQKSH